MGRLSSSSNRVNALRLNRTKRLYRRGAAATEFALVAPIFLAFLFGIIEFGRAFMALQILNVSARSAARMATLPGTNNVATNKAARDSLTGTSINPEKATIRILVNGVEANPITAKTGDAISVTVSIPYRDVSWLPGGFFLKGGTLRSTAVMRHE